MSKSSKYLCGTPDEHCTGGLLQTDQQLQHKKCHSSPSEAYRCTRRYYINVLGYKVIKGMAHDLMAPDGSSILMLGKKSKFGGRLKNGKENRNMPDEHSGAGNRGLIH